MREIKCRAWDKQTRNWCELYTVDNAVEWYNRKHSIFRGFFDRHIILMQYTGLKDKNGKEIYEGDIIAHKGKYHTVIGQILFGKIPSNREVGGDQGFYIEWQNNGANEWDNWWRHDMYYWTEQVEVIGNIHDNSELLEVSE